MVAKSTRANVKVSEHRLKRRGEATVYLLATIVLFQVGGRTRSQ